MFASLYTLKVNMQEKMSSPIDFYNIISDYNNYVPYRYQSARDGCRIFAITLCVATVWLCFIQFCGMISFRDCIRLWIRYVTPLNDSITWLRMVLLSLNFSRGLITVFYKIQGKHSHQSVYVYIRIRTKKHWQQR